MLSLPRFSLHEGTDGACVVAFHGAFDLDHTSAQVRQHHGAIRTREHAGQIQDGDIGERARAVHGFPTAERGSPAAAPQALPQSLPSPSDS